MVNLIDRRVLAAFAAAALLLPVVTGVAAEAKPKHHVIACYFHRTVRCPTCRKISAYIEEATKTGFPKQMKADEVRMVMMDFQDPKNRESTEAYGITGPTLVIMDAQGDTVTTWKTAPKVWSLVGDKDAFFKYVQGEIRSYLEKKGGRRD